MAATKLRVLDVIGLALAGSETPFGRSTRAAARALSPPGPSRILGTGERVAAVDRRLRQRLVRAGARVRRHPQRVDRAHEQSCRGCGAGAVGKPASIGARRHRRHCAGQRDLLARRQRRARPVSPAWLSSDRPVRAVRYYLSRGQAPRQRRAGDGECGAGICGSMAAGLLECWVDGTQSKFLHSGFAAQSGIAAATLAHAGVTGPPTVLEGRFGLFASHLQHAETKKDFSRVTAGLASSGRAATRRSSRIRRRTCSIRTWTPSCALANSTESRRRTSHRSSAR